MAIKAVRQSDERFESETANYRTLTRSAFNPSLGIVAVICAALVGCGGGGGDGTSAGTADTSQTSAPGQPDQAATTQSGSIPVDGSVSTSSSNPLLVRGASVSVSGLSSFSTSKTSAPTSTTSTASTTPSASTTSSSNTPASTPTASSAASGSRPFTSDSPWNAPIPSNASYGSASDPRTVTWRNAATKLRTNTRRWTMWVWQASNSDPLVSINVSVRNLDSMSGSSNPNAGTVQIRLPAAAHPDPATYTGDNVWGDSDSRDAHMTVIDPSGEYAHEFWHVEKTNGSGAIKAVSYARVPLNSQGVNISGPGTQALTGSYHNPAYTTYGWGATRAYGGSNLGGLIRAGEVTSGPIGHAIAVALPANMIGGARVWPATSDDMSPSYSGNIPMGARFAIPKSVNLQALGLSAAHLRLAQALQDYGLIVVDKSGSTCMYSEGSQAQADGDALNSNSSQMDLIHSLLTVVE